MRWLLDTLGGLWELFRLGCITGFRFKGPYWSWRIHTAFGRGMPSSRMETIHSVLAYARWMYRMRNGG